MENVPFNSIDKTFIDRLVCDKEPESRTLEYKEALPVKNKDGKIGLLADVTALANASGGIILLGIPEERTPDGKKTGRPMSADGLAGIAEDDEIRWLGQIFRAGVDPRIPGVQVKAVQGFTKGPIIVLHVPRSYIGPHMITLDLDGRQNPFFYSRTSAGNHRLDVGEIRMAFSLSDNLPELIRRFRNDRITSITSGETFRSLNRGPKLLIHIIPFNAFDVRSGINVREIHGQHLKYITPIGGKPYGHCFNFDGFLTINGTGYVQVFRDGIIELADCILLGEHSGNLGSSKVNFITGTTLEIEIIDAVERSLFFLKQFDIIPPLAITINLIGANQFILTRSIEEFTADASHRIDRDNLFLPPIELTEYPQRADIEQQLKTSFDVIWQAAGWPESMSYLDGQWNGIPEIHRLKNEFGD